MFLNPLLKIDSQLSQRPWDQEGWKDSPPFWSRLHWARSSLSRRNVSFCPNFTSCNKYGASSTILNIVPVVFVILDLLVLSVNTLIITNCKYFVFPTSLKYFIFSLCSCKQEGRSYCPVKGDPWWVGPPGGSPQHAKQSWVGSPGIQSMAFSSHPQPLRPSWEGGRARKKCLRTHHYLSLLLKIRLDE